MLSGKADPGSVLSSVASVPLWLICLEKRLLGSVRREFGVHASACVESLEFTLQQASMESGVRSSRFSVFPLNRSVPKGWEDWRTPSEAAPSAIFPIVWAVSVPRRKVTSSAANRLPQKKTLDFLSRFSFFPVYPDEARCRARRRTCEPSRKTPGPGSEVVGLHHVWQGQRGDPGE